MKIKKFISWASFVTILFVTVLFSVLCGIFAANCFVSFFNLKGLFCLFGVFPLFFVSFAVEIFIILGLQKFGENQQQI